MQCSNWQKFQADQSITKLSKNQQSRTLVHWRVSLKEKIAATVLNSRINSWETWFIFNDLRKITISQHCNPIHGHGIIMIRTENILHKLMAISIVRETVIFCTYLNGFLLGAPREYILHGLNPGLNGASCWFCFPSTFLVCSGPPGILLFVLTDRVSHLTTSLLTGRLLTNVQRSANR